MRTAEKQRGNSGRDERGRFEGGNAHTFRKGQSGNPAGRPKSLTLSEAYRRELAKVDPDDPQGRTHAEVLAGRMIARAKTGDVQALKELADRVVGKPRQTVALTSDRRDQIERAVERMVERAASDGRSISWEEAVIALSAHVPDASQLIH
jgi:hypothetical protein